MEKLKTRKNDGNNRKQGIATVTLFKASASLKRNKDNERQKQNIERLQQYISSPL